MPEPDDQKLIRFLRGTSRRFAGLAAFFGTWILVFAVGADAGDYWFWLGLLFGWVPGILAANLAERLWPLLLIAGACLLAWWLYG